MGVTEEQQQVTNDRLWALEGPVLTKIVPRLAALAAR
jgi:hypothetical protein